MSEGSWLEINRKLDRLGVMIKGLPRKLPAEQLAEYRIRLSAWQNEVDRERGPFIALGIGIPKDKLQLLLQAMSVLLDAAEGK